MQSISTEQNLMKEIDALERLVQRAMPQSMRPPAPPIPPVKWDPSPKRPQNCGPLEFTSFYDDFEDASSRQEDSKESKSGGLFCIPKDKPILLLSEHIEQIDKIRRSLNSRKPHEHGSQTVSTSDILNEVLDAVFVHSDFQAENLHSLNDLAPTILDRVKSMGATSIPGGLNR